MSSRTARKAGVAVLSCLGVVGAVGVGAAAYVGWIPLPIGSHAAAEAKPAAAVAETPSDRARVERAGQDELIIPPTIVQKMGLGTTAAACAAHAVALPSFQGVLALDNDHLSRIHSRFAGEVVEIGHSTDGSDPTLRVGDSVKKGDLLAVIWSSEVGQKKSELVEALNKLKAEEQLRDRLKTLYEGGAGSGRTFRDAEKDVQSRLASVANIERTLRTWRLTDEDLAEIHAEATRIAESDKLPDEKNTWARVEVRAPMSGVILEKNLVVGDIVDTTTDLFKIGELSHLVVWAHVYEEDLPLLESFPRPVQWTVVRPSTPGEQYSGQLDKIGAVIDPVQHTALVTGKVDNASGDLKIGQFVTVSIKLPPSSHELELPSTAVVDDGLQSVVFVQPNVSESRFVRRPVRIVRRFRDEVYIQSTEQSVKAGDHVVTSGALMLQNAMDQIAPPSAQAANTHATPAAPPQG